MEVILTIVGVLGLIIGLFGTTLILVIFSGIAISFAIYLSKQHGSGFFSMGDRAITKFLVYVMVPVFMITMWLGYFAYSEAHYGRLKEEIVSLFSLVLDFFVR